MSDPDPLDPQQVEALLRELLDEASGARATAPLWNTAFCASGGKTPVC